MSKRQKPKAPMYTPKQRMAYEPCKCDPRGRAPGADDAADRKLDGGYNVSKTNVCPIHHIVRSKNGTCIECD
jgi:hypothetical protein